MAITAFSHISIPSLSLQPSRYNHAHFSSINVRPLLTRQITTTILFKTPKSIQICRVPRISATTDGSGGDQGGGIGGTGGGGGGDEEGDAGKRNKADAILAVAEAGRTLENIPKDIAAAIEAGRLPGSIVSRYFELEKSPIFRWLLQFGGFKERLLADDLFLTKVAIECGVGIFTKVWSCL